MTRTVLVALILAAALHAQSFYGLGTQIEAANVPHPTGWAVIAIPANDQIWSFTEHDVQLVGRPLKVQTSTRTGIATPCKALGRVTIYCLGDSGVATAGGNISAAFAVGAIAAIPWKKWFILAGFRVLDTPSPVPGAKSTTRYAEIGFGRRFQ